VDQPADSADRDSDRVVGSTRVDRPGLGHSDRLRRLDCVALGLTAIVLALVQAEEWAGDGIAALAVAGLACLYAFWRIEHRSAEPIVDFSLFRNGPYFGASAAAFALVGAYWSVMFFQPQYLQDVRGHSAVLSGLMIMPVTVPMIFISPFSGRLIARFGARRLMTLGMALGVLGLLALTQIGADSSYALLLAGYLPFGVALGLVYAPMSTAAMAAMPAEKVGIASGVLAMDRVMAGTVALAVTGAVFHALQGDDGSFADAVGGSTWVLVALCVVGTALTWAFVRDPERPGPDPAVAGEPPASQRQHHAHHRRFHL
jgi:MFS family permease